MLGRQNSLWKIIRYDKNSQAGLKADVTFTFSINVHSEEGLFLYPWNESGHSCWGKGDAVLLLPHGARVSGNCTFGVYTQHSHSWKGLCTHPVANHILIKPLHICEWEIFKGPKLLSISIRDMGVFGPFLMQLGNYLITGVRSYAVVWIM